MRARYAAWCPRCDRGINVGDFIARVRRSIIHARCASGQDDD